MSFPDEFTDPAEKEKRPYGLEYAKTMWNSYIAYGAFIGYNARTNYQQLIEAAQGRQSLDNLKKHIGYTNDDTAQEGLTYLSLKVLPLAPKFINLVQGKINKIDYDISVDAIDPISLNQKKQFETTAKAYLNMKAFMDSIGTQATELFQDVDPSTLPETADDLDIHMQMNYKTEKALEYELSLIETHNLNDWGQIKRELGFDLTVLGLGVTWSWIDLNGQGREKRISPDRFIFSNTDTESLSDLTWAGHIDYLTPGQLKKEMYADGYTVDEIKEVINQYGSVNNYDKYTINRQGTGYYTNVNNDNITYIPVLRNQFLSEDTYKFVETTNKRGNPELQRKSFNFNPSKHELPLYNGENPTKTLIENTITNKYGGSWVIGSEVVFGYGRKPTPRTPNNRVNAKLDYNCFAPNMQKGRIVSMMAQMIEPLYMTTLTWTKIKDILAKEYIGILNIDLPRLTKVAMTKKSGEAYTPKDILNLFFQSKIGLSADNTNQHDQTKGNAFSFEATGLTLTDYINTFQLSINQIKNIIGVNDLSDGSTPATNTLNGVMQQSNESTNTALDYLYHGYKHIYNKTSESQLLFLQFNDPDPIPLAEFIIGLNKRPDQIEWEAFYASVEKQVQTGAPTTSDQIFLRNVTNLKLAEQIMIARERKRSRENAQIKQADITAQSDSIKEQSQFTQKLKDDSLRLEYELKIDLEKEIAKGALAVQKERNAGNREVKSIDHNTKVQTTVQTGTDSIIKEAQRSHSDQTIAFHDRAHEQELADKQVKAKKEEAVEKD